MTLTLFSLRNKADYVQYLPACQYFRDNTKNNFICYLLHRNQFKIHFWRSDGGYNSRHRNITLVGNDETDRIIT